MAEPLSWVWVAQALVLILGTATALALLVLLVQRQRPLRIEVLTREVNKSWEELKAEIEARSPTKVQWVYHGMAEKDKEKASA
jgi:hypothetical protein